MQLNLRQKKKSKPSPISKTSLENLKTFASFLDTALRRPRSNRKPLGPTERALFYSQIFVESAFFSHLSETKKFSTSHTDSSDPQRLAMSALVHNVNSDSDFKEKVNSRTSNNYGQYRGRGLIQLTGCDNMLSAIHYLNMEYSGKNPEWISHWDIRTNEQIKKDRIDLTKKYRESLSSDEIEKKIQAVAKQNQIGPVCNDPQKLEKLINSYSESHPGMSLNLFGAVKDPFRFSMPGADFTDEKTKKRITGEKFMVDTTLAYWNGRCGKDIQEFIRSPKSSESVFCPSKSDRQKMNDQEIISYCATKCVKGSVGGRGEKGGWHDRHHWFLEAQKCVK